MKFIVKESVLTLFLAVASTLSLPLKALDYSEDRLRTLGREFNVADRDLLALSQKATCSEQEFEAANTNATKIRAIKTEVVGVVADLKKAIQEEGKLLSSVENKLDPNAGKKPTNFLQIIWELTIDPTIILPADLDKLISIVNGSTQISFVDSAGIRRMANAKDKATLAKDAEARAVLASVALSWLSSDQALRTYQHNGGKILDTNPRRLSNSKSKSKDYFYLSDAELLSVSSDVQLLHLHSGVSVEAIAFGFAENNNGALGMSDAIRKMRGVVDVPALTRILNKVKAANQKTLITSQLPAEEVAVLVIQRDALKAKLDTLKNAEKQWSTFDTNLDFPAAAAKTRLDNCKMARNKIEKKVEDKKAASTPVNDTDTGVLRGVFNHEKVEVKK